MSCQLNIKERLRKIKIGNGIGHIVSEVYEILGNPFVIHDMEYKLITCSEELPEDDPICAEFMKYGRLSRETIEFFASESFVDSVSNSTSNDGVTYLISDKLKYDRIFGQLYNKSKMPVADLVMVASKTPFSEDTAENVKAACEVLSKALARDAYFQDYGQAYQEDIIKKLIEGGIEDKAAFAGHVANIDAGLKNHIFVAAVSNGRRGADYSELARLRDALKRVRSGYKYYVYSDHVIILISSNNRALNTGKGMHVLNEAFEREDVYAGISDCFENLYELPEYYNEAAAALARGLNGKSGKRIFLA